MSSSELPVLDRVLDNTALSTYMACPREYLFSMLLHRRSQGVNAALTFGTAWHIALEVHYKTNGERELVHSAVSLNWKDHGIADDHRTLARVLLEYDKYLKKFGRPTEEAARGQGRTLGWPNEPLVELSTNVQTDDLIHSYALKIDRIIELNGLYFIEDHKTTSRLDRNYFTQFELSNQMKGYVALANKLIPSIKIVGVRINLLHLLKDKSDIVRHLQTYTPEQLDEWAGNTNEWIRRVADDERRYREQDPWAFPAHFGDNGCSRKYGMCQFHHICSLNRKIRYRELERQFEEVPWNPLELKEDIDI